jgi:hypothetical protein
MMMREYKALVCAPGRLWVVAVALCVGAIIAALGVWAQNAALVGVNYDDGIYALLAKAVAEGSGYRLTFLPIELPGVKYPPAYSLSLVPFWELAASQEGALLGMKLANGLYLGLAAALFAYLLTDLRILPLYLSALTTLIAFAAGSMMLVTAGVLSEPLYLVLLFAALWSADAVGERPGIWRLLVIGVLAGLVVLTRTVGIALLVAVAIGLWRRTGRRGALIGAGAAVIVVMPWIVFSLANASRVPSVLVPRYGSYTQLYLANLGGSLSAAFDIFSANLGAILQTLGAKLVPAAGELVRSVGGAVFIALAALGSLRVFKKAPATALYPWVYLVVVAVWSFPPFRFVFILFPMLLVLAVVSVPVLAERAAASVHKASHVRSSLPRAAILALGVAVLASLAYRETRSLQRRVWDGAELDKSAAGSEVIDWVLKNTEPEAVIAYEFDPLIALHTGRRVVPNNYEPVHIWYRKEEPPIEPLARMIGELGVDYVAVRGNVPLAAAPVEALVERYPQSLRLTFVGPLGNYIFATDLAQLRRNLTDARRQSRSPDGVQEAGELP